MFQTANGTAGGKRWAVVLAGGDGKRLLQMTRVVSGDDRPKQFCALLDSDTLLEKTRRRAEKSVAPERMLFALTAAHRRFFLREPGIRPSQRIIQPFNKGTAPPIVYSLLSIERLDREAIVAILPSDHHYSDEKAFTAALESAFDTVARSSGSVLLLGSVPRTPDTELGWIELEKPELERVELSGSTFRIRRFYEKPSPALALQLFDRGALWNTFVMVGRVRDFLDMIGAARTGLLKAFPQDHLWTGAEVHVPDWVYERISTSDFSREILSTQAGRLVAKNLGNVEWSDLGQPERVIDVLRASGQKPWWMKEWRAIKRPPATVGSPLTEAAVA